MFIKLDKIERIYELNNKLGNGLHANVYDAKELQTGDIHALKISKKAITKKKRKDAELLFAHESTILKQIDHENIIKFYAAYEYPYHYAISMERLYGGELFDYIASLEEIIEDDSKKYAKQVLNALEYLHTKNIAHLDIKPENIILVDHYKENLKLIDFSLSCIIDNNSPIKQLGGTIEFMAPEAINYEIIGTETDMWSFGVLLFILLTGCSPFLGDSDEKTQTNILQNNVDYNIEELTNISSEAIDIVKSLLVHQRKDRISALQCRNHSWFRDKNPKRSLKSRSSIKTDGFSEFQARKKWVMGTRMIIRMKFNDNPVISTL